MVAKHILLLVTSIGTLVVCPVIALTQWKTEIEKFTDGSLTVGTYHGPDRESQIPREMLKKYDVVLTTYQVVEADFRKMTSPNRVQCPNCGGRFKLDKLPIHLKYFCGEGAQKTEAQARQRRNSDNDGDIARGRRGRRPSRPFGNNEMKGKKSMDTKEKKGKDVEGTTKQSPKTTASSKKTTTPTTKHRSKSNKKQAETKRKSSTNDIVEDESVSTPRRSSSRGAARKAASQIAKSAADWMPPDNDSDSGIPEPESSSDEESQEPDESSESSDSDSDNSALLRARAKQQQALERARKSKGKKATSKGDKKAPSAAKEGRKSFTKKGKKKFDDDYDDDSSSSDDSDVGNNDVIDIDMDELVRAAMAGGEYDQFHSFRAREVYCFNIGLYLLTAAKNSTLHSLCWWRIILGEQDNENSRCLPCDTAQLTLCASRRGPLYQNKKLPNRQRSLFTDWCSSLVLKWNSFAESCR